VKQNWFRSDLTFDFGTPAKYWVDTAVLPTTYTARIETATALVNIYADLGTWYGLTPYVGGGVGGSYLRTTEFHTATVIPPLSSEIGGSYNFSWALMAGASYGFGRVAVDVGYRRLNLGPAVTGVDALGNQLSVKNLAVDELRVGMRLAL
jgi:opacity protein-like surface antigen